MRISPILSAMINLDTKHYLFSRLDTIKPGKNYLFVVPFVLTAAATVFAPLYTPILAANTGGAFAGPLIFRASVKKIPRMASFENKSFIPKYIFMVYLVSLLASLTFMHLSVYIGVAISFFTAFITAYVYDESKQSLFKINDDKHTEPIIYS